jgi:C1A family cysteine protease
LFVLIGKWSTDEELYKKKEPHMAINIKYYGWIPDRPDIRDLRYSAPRRLLKNLPPKIDLSSQLPACYDQGSLGSCTANAGAGIFELNQAQQGISWGETPSRLFLYYNTRILEGTVNEDSGASIRSTIKAMVGTGMCTDSEWAYDIDKFAIRPPDKAYAFAKDHTAVKYQRLSQDLNQLKGCLAAGEAFIFGFSVYTSFESGAVAKSGILELPKKSESLLGGHAVMAVGYDESIRRFIIRNSWGTDWGKNGHFTMPYDFILNSNLADDFWTVSIVR